MHRALALSILLALAACATPAQRIAEKLEAQGVPPNDARCIGERLEARLSSAQLLRLADIIRLNRDRVGRMTIGEIARLFSDPHDAAIAAEVLRAGIGCAI